MLAVWITLAVVCCTLCAYGINAWARKAKERKAHGPYAA